MRWSYAVVFALLLALLTNFDSISFDFSDLPINRAPAPMCDHGL